MANSHGNHGGGHGGDHPSVEILSQMGYEQRDISLPALRNYLFGFIVFLLLMLTIPYYLVYKLVVPTYAEQLNQPMRHQRRVPPFPQVQPQPKPDMMVYRSAEDRVIDGQAAMPNDEPGMPIDQAIDQLATQKGISGITGTAQKSLNPNSNSYPGGGDYGNRKTNISNPSETAPGGAPGAPIMQGAATNPTVKTTAGVGNTAGGKPGVGAPGAVSGTPAAGAPVQGASPTPEASASPVAGAATTP